MSSTFTLALPALVILFLASISTVCNSLAEPSCYSLAWLIVPALAFLLRPSGISLLAITGLLALHAQWGIAQFIVQHDLGFQLIGESVLIPDTPAVAKFTAGDEKLIRAYGPYAHANDFGGVMAVAAALILMIRHPVWRRWVVPIIALALLLSFSRTAYLGGVFVLLIAERRHLRAWLPVVGILIILTPLLLMRFTDSEDRALAERLRGYTWAASIIAEQPSASGTGLRRYEDTLNAWLRRKHIPHDEWEVAPVHSVPLLLTAEFGLVPAAAIIGLTLLAAGPGIMLVLPAALPALLFDHYFLTNITAFALLGLLLYNAKTYGGGISAERSTSPAVAARGGPGRPFYSRRQKAPGA